MRREFVLLDLLRFLAALCVLVFHFEIFAIKGSSQQPRLFGAFDSAVDFFFILSGFVIAHSSADRMGSLRDYGAFLWRRLARIYPLHILTLALAGLIAISAAAVGFRIEATQRYALEYLLANLLLTQAWGFHDRLSFNIVSWSISAEWFLYLTFPLTLWLGRHLGFRLGFGLLVVWYVGIRLLEAQLGLLPWNDRTFQFAMVRALPAFFLGILLWSLWKQRLSERTCPVIIVAALGATCLLAMGLRAPSEVLIVLFGALVLTGAMSETDVAETRGRAFSRLLGGASYGLYMWHYLLGMVVFAALKPQGAVSIAAVIVFATAASIGTAMLSFRYFERPVQKAARFA